MKTFLILASLLSIIGCKTAEESNSFDDVAKGTVQKVFRYSLGEKYDSLRLIMSSGLITRANNDYLKDYFGDIRKAGVIDGIPDKDEFSIGTSELSSGNEFTLNYIPRSSDSSNVDSVKFTFSRIIGFEKVWVMQVFKNQRCLTK